MWLKAAGSELGLELELELELGLERLEDSLDSMNLWDSNK